MFSLSLSVLQLQVLGGPTISPCCMYPRLLEPQKNTGNFEVLEILICWICPSLCSVVFLIGHLAGGNFPFWLFWIDWHGLLCQRSNKLYDGGWFRLKTACSAIKQSQFLPTRVLQGHFHTAFMKSELKCLKFYQLESFWEVKIRLSAELRWGLPSNILTSPQCISEHSSPVYLLVVVLLRKFPVTMPKLGW